MKGREFENRFKMNLSIEKRRFAGPRPRELFP